ncbi:MAG: DUF5107 domain-containing protein [Anaerolineae bacterium]
MPTTMDLTLDGIPLIRLANDHLQVVVAPTIGGRIVSLIHRPSGHEFLWRNAALPLEQLPPGTAYDPHFYGGIDELLPNDIPERINGVDAQDHGELWTTPLEAHVEGDALILAGTLPLTGLTYQRRMTLRAQGPYLDADYTIDNPTGERRIFLWKPHAALNIRAGDRIVCPARTAQVGDPAYSRWHTLEPFPWPMVEGQRADVIPPDEGSVEFLYLYDLEQGRMAWVSREGDLTFAYTFDTQIFPYAWIFASYGGFEGHYTATLEPCTTMPIAVAEAAALGQTAVLESGETLRTRISTYAGPVDRQG